VVDRSNQTNVNGKLKQKSVSAELAHPFDLRQQYISAAACHGSDNALSRISGGIP